MNRSVKALFASAAAVMMIASVSCSGDVDTGLTVEEEGSWEQASFMTYDEYTAAPVNSDVAVQCTVQATQSWWDNKITVYAADSDGAYFIYNMACSEDDSENLVPGTVILVTGIKSEWEGEIEIIDAVFEFVPDAVGWVMQPADLTPEFGDEEALELHQNQFFRMTGLTVVPIGDDGEAFLYNWDGSGSRENNSDLYFKVSDGEHEMTCTVESYLTGAVTENYANVETLNVGDMIDIEGYMFWYQGPNPHITSVTVR